MTMHFSTNESCCTGIADKILLTVMTCATTILAGCSLGGNSTKTEDTAQENTTKTDSALSHHVSSLGFEILYPTGWEVRETEGVYADQGTTYIFPKGSLPPKRLITNDDIREQLIAVTTIRFVEVPKPIVDAVMAKGITNSAVMAKEIAKEFMKDVELAKEIVEELLLEEKGKGSITTTEHANIDDKDTILVSFIDTTNNLQGKAMTLQSSKPAAGSNLPIMVTSIVSYRAKNAFFSETTAQMTLQSFREHYAEAWMKRKQERYIQRTKNPIGTRIEN